MKLMRPPPFLSSLTAAIFLFRSATCFCFLSLLATCSAIAAAPGLSVIQVSPSGPGGIDVQLTGTAPLRTQYSFSNFVGIPQVYGTANGTGTAALFGNPVSTAVDTAGNLYTADQYYNSIRKVTPAGMVTTLAGNPGGTGSNNGTGSAARFNSPFGVTVDAAGNVYVADCNNNTIRKVTPTGAVTTLAGKPGAAGTADGTGAAARFFCPFGVAVDAAGNIYVADSSGCTIRKVTAAGIVTTLAGQPGVSGTSDGTGSAAQFYRPHGVTVDSVGNVYVADSGNNTIRKVTRAGVVSTLAGTPGISGSDDGTGSAAQFNNPGGIALDGTGNLYVADIDSCTIRKVTSDGTVTTLGGTPGVSGATDGIGSAAQFDGPTGIAVDAWGNLYVADYGNYRISIGMPQQITGGASGFNAAVGAVVSGSANPHGLPATVRFGYGADTNYGSFTPPQAIGSGTSLVSLTGTLTGLSLSGPCHYRLVFANSEGTFCGADRILNVPGYTVNEATVTGTSITFGASVNPNGALGPSTSATSVLVSWQYGLVAGSYTSPTTAKPVGTGTTAVAVAFTKAKAGLTASIYHYRLVIVSASGTTYGPDQVFSVKPPTLTYPAAAVTLAGATLSPTVNPNGLDTTVWIQYGLTTTYSGSTATLDIGSGFTPVSVTGGSLTGLEPNTVYHYRVVTSNSLSMVYGPDQTFATQAMYGTAAIASKGDSAPGIPGAAFSVLGNPAINAPNHTAFQATITGRFVN